MWCSRRSGSAGRPVGCATNAGRWTPGCSVRRPSAPAVSPYALRTLPVALDAARVIRDVAPDAWLINFTNPAGLVTEALRTVLGDRVIGICDSPIGLVRRARTRGGARPGEPLHRRRSTMSASTISAGCGPCARAAETCCPACCPTTQRWQSFEEGRLFGGPLLRALGCLPNEYAYFYYAAVDLVRALEHGQTRGEVVADDQAAFYAAALADSGSAADLWAADPAPARGELPGRDPRRPTNSGTRPTWPAAATSTSRWTSSGAVLHAAARPS